MTVLHYFKVFDAKPWTLFWLNIQNYINIILTSNLCHKEISEGTSSSYQCNRQQSLMVRSCLSALSHTEQTSTVSCWINNYSKKTLLSKWEEWIEHLSLCCQCIHRVARIHYKDLLGKGLLYFQNKYSSTSLIWLKKDNHTSVSEHK